MKLLLRRIAWLLLAALGWPFLLVAVFMFFVAWVAEGEGDGEVFAALLPCGWPR